MRSAILATAAAAALSLGTSVLAPAAAVAAPMETAVSGLASWYGPGFHGRRTASGEIFNADEMTAAHRSLPFGSRVKVTNHRTGRSTVVRINDRGPYAHGRIIDLSRASAEAIGITGVASVSLARF